MEKVKELLMRQMELLHEQAKKTESADDLAALTRGMIGLSAEMRDIRCGIGTRTVFTTAFDTPSFDTPSFDTPSGDQNPG